MITNWQSSTHDLNGHLCNCIGPQNGQPLCPCRMRGVKVENGRYVQHIDHGPVRPQVGSVKPVQQGCICPPGAEATCRGQMCPRRSFATSAGGAIA